MKESIKKLSEAEKDRAVELLRYIVCAEVDDVTPELEKAAELFRKNANAVELGKLGGLKGGPARANKLSRERRSEIAHLAARARWDKNHES